MSTALALPRGRVRARHVLSLAWPALVSMLSYTAMNLADTLFTGWLGTAQLAAVGLATTVSFFVLTPARGLLRGVKILTAQRTGAEDEDRATRLLAQGVWLALVLGTLVGAVGPFAPAIFRWLGASAEVEPHAVAYFAVRVAWAPLACLVWTLEGWFHGRGDTRTPMVASLLGNGVNIVLDPLMIFGWAGFPAMGVAGAAWATIIAMSVSLAVLAWRARGALPLARWGLDFGLVRKVFRLGVPLAAQWTLDFGGFLVFLGLLARAGDAHLAAHVLVFRIVQVSFLPGFAIGDAAGVLVGQAVGARRPAAARQAWWAGTQISVAVMAAFGVVFLLVPTWLVLPFGAEPEVVELAVWLLALAAAWQVFDAIVMVNFNALTGAGDTRFTLALFVGGSWLVQVPLSLWLVGVLEWGAIGAWVALTAEITAVSLVSLWRVSGRGWLEARISGEERAEDEAPTNAGAVVAAK